MLNARARRVKRRKKAAAAALLPPPRHWGLVTVGLMVLLPLGLAVCGWLIQPRDLFGLLFASGLALALLVTGGVLCGPAPGTCVALLGFALLLFVGPALGDYVLDRRGETHEGVVIGVHREYRRHGHALICEVAPEPTGALRPSVYSIGEVEGCSRTIRSLDHVELRVDPEGWLPARLHSPGGPTDRTNSAAWSVGLLIAVEACALYGRLRIRPRG